MNQSSVTSALCSDVGAPPPGHGIPSSPASSPGDPLPHRRVLGQVAAAEEEKKEKDDDLDDVRARSHCTLQCRPALLDPRQPSKRRQRLGESAVHRAHADLLGRGDLRVRPPVRPAQQRPPLFGIQPRQVRR
jgi:hypothetical protein